MFSAVKLLPYNLTPKDSKTSATKSLETPKSNPGEELVLSVIVLVYNHI